MEGSILYELVGCCQWTEEKELGDQSGGTLPEKPFSLLSKFGSGKILKRKPSVFDLSEWLTSLGPYWKFAPRPDGKVVAVLQPTILETRSEKDNFSSHIGRSNILKDVYPGFRCMAWNDEGSLLAVSFTNGQISFFDVNATQLFVVRIHQMQGLDSCGPTQFYLDFALSGMFFIEERVRKSSFPNELVTVDRRGIVKSFRQTNADLMSFHHEASLRRYYPHGVTTVTFSKGNSVMLVGGVLVIGNQKLKIKEKNLQFGITAWRLINDHPYYRIVFTVPEQELRLDSRSLWNMAFSALSSSSVAQEDAIYRCSISPDEKLLAGIHTSGAISIWHLPSLKIYQLWPLKSQFQFNAENPRFNCNWRVAVNKMYSQQIDPWRYHPFDISWWNSDVVIISRCNGCVSLCSVKDHVPSQNLLGDSPELFESPVHLSSRIGKGFFAFESDVKSEDGRDLSMSELDIVVDDFWIKAMCQEVMFWLTDMEQFRPARKRKKKIPMWIQTHRLMNVKSITPQELFYRKIDAEEYGEALDIARIYNLDSDLVFQRRWTKCSVTSQSIKDYLGKISKRNWVLQECLDRVPERIDAARELLEFGLKGTEITAAVTISQGRDKGRFIMWAPDDLDVSESDYLGILDKTNPEVRRLIDYRRKLLHFLDILNTYEIILGGALHADEKYDYKFYMKLRCQTVLESSMLMASKSDTNGLKILLTHHWSAVEDNYFQVISSFPETVSPRHYREFLPEVTKTGTVSFWKSVVQKKKDWSDDFAGSDGTALNKSIIKTTFTIGEVEAWYKGRVMEIERTTGLTNFALELARMGLELNIQGLKELVEALEIVDILVYDIKLEEMTIEKLESLTDQEKLRLLMSKVNEQNFVDNFRYYAIPFLEKVETRIPGSRFSLINDYLVWIAESNLQLVLLVFEKSQRDSLEPLISDPYELLQLAHNCIYASGSGDQADIVQAILKCLPTQTYGVVPTGEMMALRDSIMEIESQFSASKIIEKYGLHYSLAEIQALAKDQGELQRFFQKLCQYACKKTPPMKISEWKSLLYDILELQKKVFPEFDVKSCYMIYVRTLLRSGSSDIINLAKNFLDQTPTEVETDDKGNLKILRQNSTSYSTTYALYLFLIPYEESLGMILEGAEFYFDSACTYADPDIELAKTCLNLMHDTKEPNITLLFDLIDAMKLLNKDFALNVLPQTVRKCVDKLGLLKKAMENIPNGYKKIQQLLKLSVYLHVDDMDIVEVESFVYEIAGTAGLEAREKDVKFCMQVCHNIIAKNYETGWKIFTETAKDNSDPPIVDHETRLAFINYALNICPSEEILQVLNAKYLIEIRRLHSVLADISPESMQEDVKDEEVENAVEDEAPISDPDLLYKAKLEDLVEKTSSYTAWINPLKKMAEVVETSRKVLLSSKDTVSNLVSKSGFDSQRIEAPKQEETSNEDFAREAYPLLYIEQDDTYQIHVSRLASKYDSFSENSVSSYIKSRPALELSLTVNQIWHLERLLLGENEVGQRDVKVIEQLVSFILPEDIPWGMAILLSIDDPTVLSKVLESVPHSEVFTSIMLVFLAFRINRQLRPEMSFSEYTLANLSTIIMELSEKLAEEKSVAEDAKLGGFVELFNKYLEYMVIPGAEDSQEVEEKPSKRVDSSESEVEDCDGGDGWET